MRFLWRILVTVAIAVPALSAREGPDIQPSPATVSLDGIVLKDIGMNSARLELRSHVTASRNLKIKSVSFAHMRLGNLPIYLSPIEETLALEKGVPAPLPRIPLTIYFRDLDSLDPMAQAVRDGKVTVSGQARVDLDLNLLERLAAREMDPHADMPVDVTVPVEVPGGSTGRTTALATLRAAQFALNLGGSALSRLHQSQKAWEQELRTRYEPVLVTAESRYSLRMRNDQQVDFVIRGLGFRISEDKFVLTGEMIEPWKFNTDVATALQTGEASLIKEKYDLLVWPNGETLDPNSARSLSRAQIHVEHTSSKTEVAHIPVEQKQVKVRLAKRESDANYALLRFARPEDKGVTVQAAPDQTRRSQNWDRLTLFRVDDNGKLELISTPAHSENGRIVLEEPIDDRAFGSLLIAPEGAIGIVQEERSGMILRAEW